MRVFMFAHKRQAAALFGGLPDTQKEAFMLSLARLFPLRYKVAALTTQVEKLKKMAEDNQTALDALAAKLSNDDSILTVTVLPGVKQILTEIAAIQQHPAAPNLDWTGVNKATAQFESDLQNLVTSLPAAPVVVSDPAASGTSTTGTTATTTGS